MKLIRPSRAAALTLALLIVFAILPRDTYAQRGVRRVRAVPGRVVVLRAYYAPSYYDPWFNPYAYGWYPRYAYGPGYPGFVDGASLRLQVTPRDTEVFIDDYYVGTVDDFDGFFQRLPLEPGEHEVTLYLPGHRTAKQMVYIQPGRTLRVRHVMEPLPAGASADPRPVAPSHPRTVAPSQPGTIAPPYSRTAAPSRSASDAGEIAIRVQPAGADILIDGERWEGPDTTEQLVVQVTAGPHHIEIRRDGYRTYASDVDVRGGEMETLNVSLSRQ